MKPYAKFAILVVAIVGTLGWLAAGGINETKTYYKEIKEVTSMGQEAMEKRIRVGGDVQKDSIVREGKEVRFVLTQNELEIARRLRRHRAAAGHVPRRISSAGGWQNAIRWCFPGESHSGQVRVQV